MHWSHYTGFINMKDDLVLVFNNISRQMDLVRQSTLETPSKEAVEFLTKRGHMTELSKEEEDLAFQESATKWMDVLNKQKKHIFVVTYDCNLRCKYCFEKSLRADERYKKRLTFEQVDQIYQTIDYYDRQGCNNQSPILLFGGEPLLPQNKDLIEYILQEGMKRGRSFAAITNGTTLDQFEDLLLAYPFQMLQITLDGVKEIHDKRRFTKEGKGTFDTIINNLKRVSDIENLQIQLKIAVDQENQSGIQDLNDFLLAEGLAGKKNIKAYLAPVFGNSLNEAKKYSREDAMDHIFNFSLGENNGEIWSELLNPYHPIEQVFKSGCWTPKYTYCKAHHELMFYDPLGNIYTCWETVGQEHFSVGTYNEGLQLSENYENWTQRAVHNMETCKECKLALLCGGGCAYSAYLHHGTINHPVCGEMRIFLEKYISNLCRRYLSEAK